MAYSRKNYLLRVVDIQTITLEHTNRGATQEWVYWNLIYPTYKISKATYYNYLAIPARRELSRMEEVKKSQLCLF